MFELVDFTIKPNIKKVKFGEEQIEALSKLETFVTSVEDTITLSGGAGTGKTSLIIEYLEYLNSEAIPYILAAPTHKAKLVMETLTGNEAFTIHQLLSLQPNLDIFELDFRELDFLSGQKSSKPNQIPYKGIIIIDEASMVGDDLFNCIIKRAQENKTKVVWVGDERQLQPVKSTKLSKVFKLPNVIILDKIYRQKEDSPVLDILATLRQEALFNIKACQGLEDSIFTFNKAMDFIRSAKTILQETVETGNVLNTKILAYTNKRVQDYNRAARKLIFGKNSENEFNHKEILMGFDNFKYNNYQFYNSLDYIIRNEPKLESRILPHCKFSLDGYNLKLYDTVYRTNNDIFVLSKQNSKELLAKLADIIEKTRYQAVLLKKAGKSSNLLWGKYYAIINSFATSFDLYYEGRVIKRKTLDYGYALTTHRSQGSSFNSVFVDVANINQCPDPEVLRQLQYVAISRTRGDAYLLL